MDDQAMKELHNVTVIWRRGATDVSWFRKLCRHLREESPDILLTHAFNSHFIAYLVRIFARVRINSIATYHGEYHPPTAIKRLIAWFYNAFTVFYFTSVVTRVISVAGCGRNSLVERGVPEDRISVIHNGIKDIVPNEREKAVLLSDLRIMDGSVVIGAVGRLEPIKGIEHLIEAFASLSATHPQARLLIIGSGVLEQDLRSRVRELGLVDKVCFAGFIPDVANYYPLMDVFVLPSLSEFHSISILEAMRASRPVIATNVGGNTESITHESEGLIVPAGNPGRLAEAICRMLDDDALRDRLATAARARYEREFKVDTMLNSTAQELLSAAGNCDG